MSTGVHSSPWRRSTSDLQGLKAENSRLLTEDIAAGSVVYRGLPEIITFNHSDICNLRCVMCPRNLAQGTNRLEKSAILHVVNEFFPTARKAVLTTAGGEPLAVDFDLMLESALRFEVKIDVVTNGVLLDRDLYRRARPAFDHLNVSLDSHVPDVYEKIRLGARFNQVLGNLEALREERRAAPDGVLYSVSAVVMRSNLDHLPEFLRFARDLDVDGVVFQRLRHDVKPTPEEDPYTDPGPDAVNRVLDQCAEVAREIGLNLSMVEHGRPIIFSRPIRSLAPPLRGGPGCWFILQNFNVLYSGDVFPCCEPTDLHLGNVLYEDPMEVWNGAPFQRLRRDHFTSRGNMWCSGCAHAPHLPAKPKGLIRDARREARWRLRLVTGWARARKNRSRTKIYDPPQPEHRIVDGGFEPRLSDAIARPAPYACEAASADPRGGTVRFIRSGRLMRTNDAFSDVTEVARLFDGDAPPAACLARLPSGALIASFEGGGGLLRIEGASVERVLEFPDSRSFVRQSTVSVGRDGRVWVGEYGVYPGARCARVYSSLDDGRTFRRVAHIKAARHIHLVKCLVDGRVVVTTGDLSGEQRLYVIERDRLRQLAPAWSGFTAAIETAGGLVFGTDFEQGNGIVLFSTSLDGTPDFIPFPRSLDLQVRSIEALEDRRLVALGSMDADLRARHQGLRPALMLSSDSGRSWSIAHEFEADWSDAPESLVRIGEDAFITTISTGPLLPASRSSIVELVRASRKAAAVTS